MPIENFGKSIMGKLGWTENTADPQKIKDVKPRQDRLGLGARPLSYEEI